MKVLLIDQGGVGAAMALRMAQHNHDVFWFVEPKPENNVKNIGKGLHENITMVKEWIPLAQTVDLITVTENGNYIEKLDSLRKQGVAVYAPSAAVVKLEINREAGMKFLKDHGIKIPDYKTFSTLKEAEEYVFNKPDRYVFKTLGDNDDKSLSFVGKSPEQLIEQLRSWQKEGLNPKGKVMLQEFIEGTEFAVSRWFGADGFIGPWCEGFEHKKLMSGEIGVNTGEMGTVSRYVESSKIGSLVLSPLESDLVKMGALTDIDLNCIVTDEGDVYPLEFTCRPGWPINNIKLFAHKGDPAQWMLDACNGIDSLDAPTDVMIGVVLALPPFPFDEDLKKTTGKPLYGFSEKNEPNIQPQSIMIGEYVGEDQKDVEGWVSCGNYVAVVCETAKTVEKAMAKVYKIIKDLSMSNMMYRDDIGKKVLESVPKLKKMGFAADWPDTK